VGVEVEVVVGVGVDVEGPCMIMKPAGSGITRATKFRGAADAFAGLVKKGPSRRNLPSKSQQMAMPDRAKKRMRNAIGKSSGPLPGRSGSRRIWDSRRKTVGLSGFQLLW
jgi:hypothetical protein